MIYICFVLENSRRNDPKLKMLRIFRSSAFAECFRQKTSYCVQARVICFFPQAFVSLLLECSGLDSCLFIKVLAAFKRFLFLAFLRATCIYYHLSILVSILFFKIFYCLKYPNKVSGSPAGVSMIVSPSASNISSENVCASSHSALLSRLPRRIPL